MTRTGYTTHRYMSEKWQYGFEMAKEARPYGMLSQSKPSLRLKSRWKNNHWQLCHRHVITLQVHMHFLYTTMTAKMHIDNSLTYHCIKIYAKHTHCIRRNHHSCSEIQDSVTDNGCMEQFTHSTVQSTLTINNNCLRQLSVCLPTRLCTKFLTL